ncbi:MAG TPA: carboxypeptidase-like regulatory domain-containing protein, partial [Pyrinomonadaceae bacterium]|nr:carboxypeptidase-like regulatory domain-containing protein [Pyrinomonadaceae bacterium]
MKGKLNQILTLLICGIFTLLMAATVSAQTSRGTVTGIITDPNEAVVAGAEVELKNTATNQIRTTTSNDSGLYRFDAVDLGTYEVTIRAKGFKSVKNTGVEVQANRTATLDQQLEIGATETVVDVSASGGELL